MIGKKCGKWLVLDKTSERAKNGTIRYKCKCECGNIKIVSGDLLRSGKSKSCGCSCKGHHINVKHGKSKERLYYIYNTIKQKCYNKKNDHYKWYGKRCIKICDEWLNNFQAFYTWAMNNGYKDSLTIDRINVNGNYEPSNCRWVDMKTQANDKRSNVYLTYNGRTQTMKQWADELGINYKTLHWRLTHSWSIEEALELRCL